MHRIRPWLLVGKYRETLDRPLLEANGVTAMLQMAEPVSHPGVAPLYLPVEDGVPLAPDLLRAGLDFALAQRAAGATVLIACGAGISRSVAFAIAALKETEGLALLDALRSIRLAHPEALPDPALWRGPACGWLAAIYQEATPFTAIFTELRS